MAYMLFAKHLVFNPANPEWFNRDRFVLSAGHGSALLYSMLHLFGYDVKMEDLKQFRQLDSLTPGHPEFGWTAGVDATSGPLGQGIGMAMEWHLQSLIWRRNITNQTTQLSTITRMRFAVMAI